MRNLVFVIWMLGWSISRDLSEYLQFLRGKTYPETVEGIAAFTWLVAWIWVGVLLYEKKK